MYLIIDRLIAICGWITMIYSLRYGSTIFWKTAIAYYSIRQTIFYFLLSRISSKENRDGDKMLQKRIIIGKIIFYLLVISGMIIESINNKSLPFVNEFVIAVSAFECLSNYQELRQLMM